MWLIVAGVVLLIAVTVDVAWTTLGTHGGGPISSPLTKGIWKVMLAVHHRKRMHRALSFGGTVILLSLFAFWLVLMWSGWLLIFAGEPSSVLSTSTQRNADVVSRIYFVGTMMFTAGTSQYAPRSGGWEIVAAFLNCWGLVMATLAITYLLAVLGAIVEKRSTASFVWDMGGTPARIIDRAWDGQRFSDLSNPLTRMSELLETFAEQHLAYPILQYYHSENRRTAAPLRIAALHDVLLLLGEGAAAEVRPSKLLIGTGLDSVRGFAEVVAREFVRVPEDPPPPPDLGILRALGIPTVDDATFRLAINDNQDVRKRLLGMIIDTGWAWEDAFDMDLLP